MDVHVRARLDLNGKIQSVTSSCSQTQDNNPSQWGSQSPSSPFGMGGWDVAMVEGEKVVPYVEKKDLVKKLDTKVDEMSLMVMQMAQLTQENELQAKLIKQYEDKIKTLERKVERLNSELRQCTCHGPVMTRPRSNLSELSAPERKLVRSSQTSIKVVCSVETETTVTNGITSTLGCDIRPNDSIGKSNVLNSTDVADNVERENDLSKDTDDAIENNGTPASVIRPNTLNIESECDGSVTSNLTDTEKMSGLDDDIVVIGGYSYAKKQAELILQAPEHNDNQDSKDLDEDDEVPIYRKPDKNRTLDNTDASGYLVLPQYENIPCVPPPIPEHDNKQDSGMDAERKSSVKELTGSDPEKDVNEMSPILHKRPNDGYVCPISAAGEDAMGKSPAVHKENTDTYIYPTPLRHMLRRTPRYVEINDNEIMDDRPPKPIPRRQRSKSDDHTNEPDQTSPTLIQGDYPVTVVDTPDGVVGATQSRLHDRTNVVHGRIKSMPSSKSCESNGKKVKSQTLPAGSARNRSNSTPNLYKPEDQLNVVLKDMRTTMEWNQEKQNIVFKSTSSTALHAEQQLVKAVQKLNDVFQTVFQKRTKKVIECSIASLTKRVKDSAGHDFEVSDEFCSKCLSLCRSAVTKVKTP